MTDPTLDQDAVRRELQRERQALTSEMGDLTLVTRDPSATIGFGNASARGQPKPSRGSSASAPQPPWKLSSTMSNARWRSSTMAPTACATAAVA